MASQRTDTSDIPSIASIREFHVKDESESIAPNYLRLLLLERFSLTVTPRDPSSRYFAVSFGKKEQKPFELFGVIIVNICRGWNFLQIPSEILRIVVLFSRKTRKKRTGRELPLGRAASYRVSFLFLFFFFSLFYLRTFHGCKSFECGLRCMHCVNEHPKCLPPGKIALPLTSTSIQTFAIVRLTFRRSLFEYNHRIVNANLANPSRRWTIFRASSERKLDDWRATYWRKTS